MERLDHGNEKFFFNEIVKKVNMTLNMISINHM